MRAYGHNRFRFVAQACFMAALVGLWPVCLPGQARAQSSGQAVLRKLAQHLLQARRVNVEMPSFENKQGVLYYFLGDALVDASALPPSAQPADAITEGLILAPLEDQIRIELLRQFLASPQNGDWAFLKTQVQEAEKIVSQALAEIDANRDAQAVLERRLKEKRQLIDALFDQALRAHAAAKKLDLFKVKSRTLSASYRVSFQTEPQGGLIYYVDEFQWKVATSNAQTPNWLEWAHTDSRPLDAGTYRIKVVWPGPERGETERTIEIVSNGSLTLRRD